MEVGTQFKKKEGTSKNNEKQKNIQKTARNSEKTRLRTMQKLKLMDLQDFRQLPIIESVCPSTLS